jgi:hypothetical protein
MYESVQSYLNQRAEETSRIEHDRRVLLAEIAGYASGRLDRGERVRLIFICTHNSRRSHLAQIWAAVCAQQVSLGVETFSGGTERTGFYRSAVEAVERAGCRVGRAGDGGNPQVEIRIGDSVPAMVCFSKRYDEAPNPREGFAAVMVCGDADEACPHIAGADARFALPYTDPKLSDGTAQEALVYDERCAQIAREMHYMISLVIGEVAL